MIWSRLFCVGALLLPILGIVGVCGCSKRPAAEALTFPPSTQERVVDTRVAEERLIVRTAMKEVPRPITDPLDAKTVYRYLSTGYARPADPTSSPQAVLRFEVYAERQEDLSYADRTCLYLLRLWDMLSTRLGVDHPLAYRRVVTVFLKRSGKPGAEQRITVGPDETGRSLRRNTIYVYDLPSLTEPLQACRELAHEYGHAVLPAIGGFREPEEWINGLVGERLFLTWLLEEIESGRIPASEAFDVSTPALRAWVEHRSHRLAARVLAEGFARPGDLHDADRFIGFVLAVDAVYGGRVLGRGLLLANGNRPEDALRGIGQAISEQREVTLRVPKEAGGKPFWTLLPGSGWSLGGARMLEKKPDGWVRIEPRDTTIRAKRAEE